MTLVNLVKKLLTAVTQLQADMIRVKTELGLTQTPQVAHTTPQKKLHKKHLHLKKCDECGNEYKGIMGLHIHQHKIHGINFAQTGNTPTKMGLLG